MAPTQVDEQAIFEAARKIDSPESRHTYLHQMCGDDDPLKQRIVALLRAFEQSESFLESPPPGLGVDTAKLSQYPTIDCPIAEGPGTVIGPYKLLQEIGEGGFGVVFMAEQTQPLRRIVAIKIIKPGMDTRQVIARFEAERQALAMMDHPNIAKVLDAGMTESGRPYFVMELVKGLPITKYCDDNRVTPRERLALFITVCQAVQHAHQKGIIHRDLKPPNVLVALYDGRAVPKIIDFGVAKATGPKLTERTLFTEFGAVVGTLEYMSPEQAELNQLDVDTRSDIYGLGVLLYELLTGTTPLERKRVKQSAFLDLLRVIREEEPPKPSTRLSTDGMLPSIADSRGLEPKQLSGLVRGELDWIVMKALEKDRSRRYATANSLALELERFLADEPVEACPPSSTYRFRKFAVRNRAAILAAVIVAVSLVLGTVASIWQATLAWRAEGLAQTRLESEQEARQQATAEATKATTISTLLQQMLGSADPSAAKGSDYTVRQMLDDFSAGLGDQLRDQPAAEAAIRATIGNAYRGLQSFDKAELHLKSALELRVRLYGPGDPRVAQSLVDYSWNLYAQGDVLGAESRAREALAIHRQQTLPDAMAMRVLSALQLYLVLQAKYEEAETVAQEALAIARRRPAQFAEEATVLHNLAHAAVYQRDPVKAERIARHSVELHQKLHGENHPETAHGLFVWATALHNQQKFDEAEVHGRAALAIQRKYFDDSQGPVLAALAGLAHTLRAKRDQAGLDALRGGIDMSSSRPEHGDGWIFRGNLFAALSDWEEADIALGKAAELESDPNQSRYLFYVALVRLARDDHPGYRQVCASLAQRAEQSNEPKSAYWAARACVLAPDSLGQHARVVALAERAYESNSQEPRYLATVGAALYRAGRLEEARESFTRVIAASPAGSGDSHALTYSHLFLAMLDHRLGQAEEARQWLNQAVQAIDQPSSPGQVQLATIWYSILPLQILRQEAEGILAEGKKERTTTAGEHAIE